jgi:hypothetical protein
MLDRDSALDAGPIPVDSLLGKNLVAGWTDMAFPVQSVVFFRY